MISSSFISSFFTREGLTRAGCTLALTAVLHSTAFGAAETPRAENIATSATANAGEFATIPNGDALYGFWSQVQRASWFLANGRSAKNAKANAPKTVSMTRYEMALETGRAYFALSALARTDAKWSLPLTQRASVRALRELLNGLRPELRRLQVDVNAAIELCDLLLNPTQNSLIAADNAPAIAAPSTTTARTASPLLFDDATTMRVPLSQRLRVYAALSSLEREASDPFGESARGLSLEARRAGSSPQTSGGAVYDVADWLRVRAGFQNAENNPNGGARALLSNANNSVQFGSNLSNERAIGGGIDIELRRGLRLSGDVARVTASDLLDNNRTSGTRIAGGVGVSAWQNRLALSMNLSRLVPEDSAVLSSSAAGLNLAVGSDRVKLNLLYQQLFGDTARTRGDRVIAGGININF